MKNIKVEHIPLNYGGNLYKKEVEMLKEYYNVPKIIFDIGANIGGFTVELSKQFPDSMIYAFEPVHETFNILKDNTRNLKNVTCFNFGFFDNDLDNVPIGLPEIPPHKKHTYGRMTIYNSYEPLDTIVLKNFGKWCTENNIKPDMLKIDVEGCEYPLIKSAEEYELIKYFKLVYIEINPYFSESIKVVPILNTHMLLKMKKLNYLYIKE